MNLSRGIYVAFWNLVIVGIIGSFLRYLLIYPVSGVNYSYILHAHSHLAFLGWVFMALYVLIIYAYLPSEMAQTGKFTLLFILLQLANIGMLVTFPVMGYALWSIVFSALHAFMAMIFAWLFISKVQWQLSPSYTLSFAWIKWAMILMVLSNLAPFALGPVAATEGKGDLYYLLIYFYLHFQYNGWFTFALLGLMLWQLEREGVSTNTRLVRIGLKLKLFAVFPAFILSSLWTEPDIYWYVIGGLAAFVQSAGLICLLVFVIRHRVVLSLHQSFILSALFWVGIIALSFQHFLMLLSAVPELAGLAFSRNIVIAYLHMVLLGFVTIWLFLFFVKLKLIQLTLSSKFGFLLFFSAFILTEFVLVFQGLVSNSTRILFLLAFTQLGGLFCIVFNLKSIQLKT